MTALSPRSANKRLGAFTVAELLVAVALLSILAVLCVSGIQTLRQRATNMGDINHLRIIGAAFVQYTSENRNELPPVMGTSVIAPNYAHEHLAAAMGMRIDLRDPSVAREQLGVWISPGDRARPPGLSGLRSYSVNFYMGVVNGQTDYRHALRTFDIIAPSQKLYMLPSEGGENSVPAAQARFSDVSYPFRKDSPLQLKIRLNKDNTVPALWVDGHVTILTLKEIEERGAKLIFPKQNP